MNHRAYSIAVMSPALLLALAVSGASGQSPPVAPGTAPSDSTVVLVQVESDPEGALIRIDGVEHESVAPATLRLEPGKHALELSLDGFSSLTHELDEAGGSEFRLQFLLLRNRPERPAAEDLGLAHDPLIPLLPEESASTTLQKFLTVAETFSVIPLGAGLWLKVADQNEGQANYLMAGGLTLTLGSWYTGKKLSERRLAGIRRENERIREANSIANVNNKRLERDLDQHLREDLVAWEIEVISRGRVLVLPMDEEPEGESR